jgi:hypothetical protein
LLGLVYQKDARLPISKGCDPLPAERRQRLLSQVERAQRLIVAEQATLGDRQPAAAVFVAPIGNIYNEREWIAQRSATAATCGTISPEWDNPAPEILRSAKHACFEQTLAASRWREEQEHGK